MTLAARLSAVGTASLFEAAGKRGAMSASIKPIGESSRLAGRAVTVRVVPGDNLGLHRLLADRVSGDVIVVDAGAHTETAIWGDVLSAAARGAGYRGLVVDGAVRDVASIDAESFPVFARGVAIPGPGKSDDGTAGAPITCGGARVRPGDWIVGDDDGVVVLMAERADDILSRAEKRERREAAMIERLLAGETTTLTELGLSPAPA